jgi:hypothetical protein
MYEENIKRKNYDIRCLAAWKFNQVKHKPDCKTNAAASLLNPLCFDMYLLGYNDKNLVQQRSSRSYAEHSERSEIISIQQNHVWKLVPWLLLS